MKPRRHLRRTKALKPDPEKVRAFIQRGRENASMGREGMRSMESRRNDPPTAFPLERPGMLKRTGPLRARKKRKRRDGLPGAGGWKRRVFGRYGRKCVRCGERAGHAHHTVPVNVILDDTRKPFEERKAIAMDERQGCPVCTTCHGSHENASRRLRRSELPPDAVDWAYEHAYGGYLERTYPA